MLSSRGNHCLFLDVLFFNVVLYHSCISSLPLSANSRWIVDDANGSRVKLACVNWAAHLEPMLAEGLSKQPVDDITSMIRSLGFNCVRLTWATFMFTNASLADQTVNQSFTALNLTRSLLGIRLNNPQLVDLSLVEAYKAVVYNLGKNGLMVILDNHVSKPEWCCANTDGNGFWGDQYFDPNIWSEGLGIVAATFRNSSHVVAMSLRNELRGPRQNVPDWFKYMRMGAETVQSVNPRLLVIFSGLSFDRDLSFLYTQQLSESFRNRLVYEFHWYSFTDSSTYKGGELDRVCATVTARVENETGFLTKPNMSFTGPLIITEFGIDQRGINENDNKFITCFFSFAAAGDFDWAYWALQGSYYIRNAQEDYEEFYGLLNSQWDAPRNTTFLKRLQAVQLPSNQGTRPPMADNYAILFHPSSGLCVGKTWRAYGIQLESCGSSRSRWSYTAQRQIALKGTYLCIVAEREGEAAVLRVCGTDLNGPWDTATTAPQTKALLQFSTRVPGNNNNTPVVVVCLDGSSPPALLTGICLRTTRPPHNNKNNCNSGEDPSAQWFKLLVANN